MKLIMIMICTAVNYSANYWYQDLIGDSTNGYVNIIRAVRHLDAYKVTQAIT
eukprot:SAG11_NODE_3968_length_2129_cov_1.133498_1_plen_52_part_00